MRAGLVIAAAVFVAGAPAAAADGDVNADAFYRDARSLMGKGMGALFDKRTKPMMAHMKAAGLAAKTENDAATKAGKPVYCVPKSKKGLDAKGVVAMLGRVPEAQRKSMTLKQAWRTALVRDYPCT